MAFVDGLNGFRGRVVASALNASPRSRKAFWALSDQGIVSLGNFATQYILAKWLGAVVYGEFGVFFTLMLFLHGVHAALVVYPLTIRGAVAEGPALRKLVGTALGGTIVISPFIFLAMALTAATMHEGRLVLWVSLAVILAQLQETLRRSLLANMRYAATIVGDSVSYLGQAVIILVLARTNQLNLTGTFVVMAATSGLAVVIQAIQVKPVLSGLSSAYRFVVEAWAETRWLMFGHMTTLVTGTLFAWSIAYFLGYGVLGAYNALINIVRLSNPLIIAFTSVLVPTIARARATGGVSNAEHRFVSYATTGFAALCLIFAFPFFFPAQTVALFYSEATYRDPAIVGVLQIVVLTALLTFIQDVTSTFLNAIERSRTAFWLQLAFTGAVLVIAIPMSSTTLYGSLMGRAGASLIHVGLLIAVLVRIRSVGDRPEPELRGFEVAMPTR